jgi:hypothetical protein
MKKFSMITQRISWLLLWSFVLGNASLSRAENKSAGTVLIVEVAGEIRFEKNDGSNAAKNDFKIGSVLPVGYFAITGQGGSLVCLLSNGTLLTVRENSRIRITSFEQEAFDPSGMTMEKLDKEPSSSKVLLDLNVGSMVVKTKKLSRESILDIESPVGTAGIRGTEFQLGFSETAGVELDVTESTVAFTPKGGEAQMVTQGSGLSVSITGQVVARPLNPVVAQQINVLSEKATNLTESVDFEKSGLGAVESKQDNSPAVDKETLEEIEKRQEQEAVEEQGSGNEPSESMQGAVDRGEVEESAPNTSATVPTESVPANESVREQIQGTFSIKSTVTSNEEQRADMEQNDDDIDQAVLAALNLNPSSSDESRPDLESGDDDIDQAVLSSLNLDNGKNRNSEESIDERGQEDTQNSGETTTAQVTNSVETSGSGQGQNIQRTQNNPLPVSSTVVENNANMQLVRKTGIVSEFSNEVASFGLDVDQTVKFEGLSTSVRKSLLGAEVDEVQEILSNEDFRDDQIEKLVTLSSEVRKEILVFENSTQSMLLDLDLDEELLSETIVKLAALPPPQDITAPNDDQFLETVDSSLTGGNLKSLEKLSEQAEQSSYSGDSGAVSSSISWLRDYETGVEDPAFYSSLSDFLIDPMQSEMQALYSELEMDGLVFGTEGKVYGGENLIVRQNANALNPFFGSGSTNLILSASDTLSIVGDFEFPLPSGEGTRIVLMSGDGEFSNISRLRADRSDLIISTRAELILHDLQIDAGDELAIRGMRNVRIENASLNASELATIKARRDLEVNGLSFNSDLPRIVMEATTIRLRNVDFPAFSNVQLNSLKGPIDTKYPNFGTSIPSSAQIGRVNFIENIKVGGNPVMDRANFDYFGNNISIGIINRP